MDDLSISGALTGVILSTGIGHEASLTIPIGDYKITIISDDSCGVGKGEIMRSELFVYHKDKGPSDNINEEIFGTVFVIATSPTLLRAIEYVREKEELK